MTPIHSFFTQSVSATPMAGGGGGLDPGGGGTPTRPIPAVGVSAYGSINDVPAALTGHALSAGVWLPPLAPGAPVTYAWTVSAGSGGSNVFKDYTDINSAHCHLVPLSASDMAQATIGFYDRVQEVLTVRCHVTYTADTNITYSEDATPATLNVLKPTVSWGITTGIARHDTAYDAQGNHIDEYGLFPAYSNGALVPGGVYWHNVTVTVPAPFSGGTCCFTQLVTPDREYNGAATVANNKAEGLDNSFNYFGYTWSPSPSPAGTESDSPAVVPDKNKPVGDKITYHDSFRTWVMYQPSGGIWVPLNTYSYDWGITLTSNAGGTWDMSAQNPAPLAPGPTYTSALTKDPPEWDLVHSNS